MNEERKKILNMLAEGKITVDESERLLRAIEEPTNEEKQTGTKPAPKYLHVKVDSKDGDKVNVKIPIKLIKAGMKIKSLIPEQAQSKIDDALKAKGFNLEFGKASEENIADMIEALTEFTVDVNSVNGDKVNIYCE